MTFFWVVKTPISSVNFITTSEKENWYEIKEERLLISYGLKFRNSIFTMSPARLEKKHKIALY